MIARNEPGILSSFDAAFEFAGQQVRRLVERHPWDFVTHTVQGHWAANSLAWGGDYDGLLPGMMWIFHEETGESWWGYVGGAPPLDAWLMGGMNRFEANVRSAYQRLSSQ